MKLHQSTVEIFVPDGKPAALKRITHLGIGAHQDDLQISGGKRYNIATSGRRAANATFFESRATNKATQLIFGMDLTPLVTGETADIADHTCGFIKNLKRMCRKN